MCYATYWIFLYFLVIFCGGPIKFLSILVSIKLLFLKMIKFIYFEIRGKKNMSHVIIKILFLYKIEI